jgi:hypothetical protein
MEGKPTGWNRLRAKLAGEVPAGELEAYRHAGGPVFDLMDQMERRRLECGIDGLDPWTVPAATRAAFLCAWNAFVLQTVANDLLDADFALDPRTRGHVPPATAEQALRFYGGVDGWVSRAAQAQANPDYRLDVPVPAPLPGWLRGRPIAPAHLHGLVHAMRAVHEHADAAMGFLPSTPPEDAEKAAQLHRIRQLHAAAQVHARYAEDLAAAASPTVHERGGNHARSAIEQFYLLGQLVADPALAKGPGEAPRPAPAHPPVASDGPRVESERTMATQPVAPAPAPPSPERPPQVQAPPPAAPPPAPYGTRGPPPAFELASRRDDATRHTITEPARGVDFTGTLGVEARFDLRPVRVRQWDWGGLLFKMRVYVQGRAGFVRLAEAALTIHVDGQESVLYAWPGSQAKESVLEAGQPLYEEYVAYPLSPQLLGGICSATHLGLWFSSSRGMLVLDADTIPRVQSCCRGFVHSLKTHRDDSPPVWGRR